MNLPDHHPQGLISSRLVTAFDRAASRSSALAALPQPGASRWRSWGAFADRLDTLESSIENGLLGLQHLGGQLLVGDLLLGAVAAVVPEPQRFVAWSVDNLLAPAAPVHSFRFEALSPQSSRVTVWTTEPHLVSAGWFSLCAGLLGGLPRHLGLPPCETSAVVQGRRCVVSLAHAPSNAPRTPPARASRDEELRALVAGFTDLREHLVEQARLSGLAPPRLSFEEKIAGSARNWQLSPRESQALACVVRGLSNKETAAELGCAITTAELHVTRVLRKSGSSSRAQLTARFWSSETEPPLAVP